MSFDTKIFEEKNGLVTVNTLYGGDSKIKYINLKNEFAHDWIIRLTIPHNETKGFVYNFITEDGNFIANRIIVSNA